MVNSAYKEYANARLSGAFAEMGSWSLVSPFLEGKRVLDIGCSDGLYLQKFSPDSVGIEQISELADKAKSRGLNAINAKLEDALKIIPECSFEAVLLSHVLEHVEAPIFVLRNVERVLVTGGLLVLGLPVERCIFRSLFKMPYFDGSHLYGFTINNSAKLLNETGFCIDKIFYHLPRCRGRIGGFIQKSWNHIPFPKKEYFSMGYWVVARKDL